MSLRASASLKHASLRQIRPNQLSLTRLSLTSINRASTSTPVAASRGFRCSALAVQQNDFSAQLKYPSAASENPSIINTKISKVVPTAKDAVKDVQSGGILAISGFGFAGAPWSLCEALDNRTDVNDLWIVSNNPTAGAMGRLVDSGKARGITISHLMHNKVVEKQYLSGQIEMELTPQGNIAERCRAAGAGIPAFYTPTGYGTWIQEGKIPSKYDSDGNPIKYPQPRETREFNGKQYILEEAIEPDVAFIHAWKADPYGNCVFRYTSANHCGPMGKAAKKTIVEAEHIVPVGALDANEIHLPGSYVDVVCQSVIPKSIDYIKYFDPALESGETKETAADKMRNRIAARVAKLLVNGSTVNLGIGMPTLVANHLGEKVIHFQSENGLVGMGPYPRSEVELDLDVMNAGKEAVTLSLGASTFDSAESFGLIRSGTVAASVLGALQVSQNGDLANFMIPGKLVTGMGGAMDLVSNPDKTKVIVMTTHTDKNGNPKIVKSCDFPLTGVNCVSNIVSELAHFVVNRKEGTLTLVETAEGVTVDEIREKTDADFEVASDLGTF